jgi:hypothetical protein
MRRIWLTLFASLLSVLTVHDRYALSQEKPGAEQTLNFPSTYSTGKLRTCRWDADEANLRFDKSILNAQGQVKVPSGALLELNLSYAAAEKPDDIDQLKKIPGLIAINARDLENFDDKTMLHICKVCQLEYICADSTEVTDTGVRELHNLKKLRRLSLAKTMVTGKGVFMIGQIPSLQVLTLSRNRLDDKSMKQLAALNNLRKLDLDATGIGDEALANLAKLKKLNTLTIQQNTRITDEGLASLSELPGLVHLDLCGTSVTPKCGRFLKTCTSLTKVRVDKKFSDDDLKAVKKDLPHTWVVKGAASKLPREIFAPLK